MINGLRAGGTKDDEVQVLDRSDGDRCSCAA